jgi:hypothetical protein
MLLSKLKPNPDNPRIIKDGKFKQLVQSIKDFPQMMALRPIIYDSKMVVLGGNMRLAALKELGYKELPDEWVKPAKGLTDDQKREFIVKDNVGFGEWNWDDLANNWDSDQLTGWGLDLYFSGSDVNNLDEADLDLTEDFDPMGLRKDVQRVVFIFNTAKDAEDYLNGLGVKFKKQNMAWQVNMSIQFT